MKVRIISAILMAVVAIPLLLIGGYPYIIAISILALLSYKEILDLKKSHKPYPNLIKALGAICICLLLFENIIGCTLSYGLTYQSIISIFLILMIPTIFYEKDKYTTKDALYLVGITLVLGIAFNLLIVTRNKGLNIILYLLSISIFTDIFALIGGKLFGRVKLAEKISPNKTWEGSFAGLVAGTIGGVIVYSLLIGSFSVRLVFITAFFSIIGQLGDLFMSKMKRENEIKDFSNIIPGHGGILDRLDSIIFVVLAYLVMVFYL